MRLRYPGSSTTTPPSAHTLPDFCRLVPLYVEAGMSLQVPVILKGRDFNDTRPTSNSGLTQITIYVLASAASCIAPGTHYVGRTCPNTPPISPDTGHPSNGDGRNRGPSTR